MKKFSYFLTALSGAVFSSVVLAHSLYVVAQYDGNAITGKAYYSDMTPANETYIEAYQQDQSSPIITGKTDSSGHFNLPIQSDQALTVVVEGEEGHRASTLANRITSSPADNPATTQGAMTNHSTTASQSEFALLREDINQLKNKIYLQNILGGIGYIMGFVGIFAWWRSRKEQK